MVTPIKVVFIGDTKVGKTSLIHKYLEIQGTNNETTFDNYTTQLTHAGEVYEFNIWDTAGKEEMDKLRALSYPNTDVFVLCFAINNTSSFGNIKRYIEEIKDFSKKMLILGCKEDVRNDCNTFGGIVEIQSMEAMGKEYKVRTMTCSAEENINVKCVFWTICDVYRQKDKKSDKNQWWRCMCCKDNTE